MNAKELILYFTGVIISGYFHADVLEGGEGIKQSLVSLTTGEEEVVRGRRRPLECSHFTSNKCPGTWLVNILILTSTIFFISNTV